MPHLSKIAGTIVDAEIFTLRTGFIVENHVHRQLCVYATNMMDPSELARKYLCHACTKLPRHVVVDANGHIYCIGCVAPPVTTPVTIQSLIDTLISDGSVDKEFLERSNDISVEEASESIWDTKEKAMKGSAKHMCILSRWYMFGEKEGVDSDDEEAYKWCKQAADAEDVDGMAYQGYCFIHGHGVEKNREEGVELLVDAANHGSGMSTLVENYSQKYCETYIFSVLFVAFAAYTIGCCYHTGLHGFDYDAQKAAKYLKKAKELTSESSCALNTIELENIDRYLSSYGSPPNVCTGNAMSVPSEIIERKENDTVSIITQQS